MSVRRAAAAALAAGLLLTGCSDDPEPRFEPTGSPSPTESSSSAAPQAQTPEEFIREWVTAYNEFESTGDASTVRRLSGDCAACSDIIDVVSDAYSRGGYLRSDGWTLPAEIETTYSRKAAVGLRASVKVAASEYRASGSSKIVRTPAAAIVMEFDLEKTGQSWRMFDLTRVAS